LIELTGCAGYKVVPNTNLSDYNEYNHVIYLEKSRYVLDSTIISAGFLSGIIDSKKSDTRNAIHVYPLTDSFVKIDTADFLTFQWILLKR
jgi:hypothetical protein